MVRVIKLNVGDGIVTIRSRVQIWLVPARILFSQLYIDIVMLIFSDVTYTEML